MKLKRTFLLSLIICVVVLTRGLSQSFPIKIVITVTPPYPVSVSYYADHPDQVLVQVINMSSQPQSFRLVGSINGIDNNVKIVAKEHGASNVITLNASEARMLSSGEIRDLFDARKLVFTGINFRPTQIDDGLPEGLYNVCAYAVDAARTNVQRSEQTCSNAFQLSNLEPPIIISPVADAELPVTRVQNIVFSWTLPAMAPPTTEYTLRVVEVLPGMNPNQAIQAASTPSFFERAVNVNTYLYGPADPPLIEGRRYAFMVTARDPQGAAVFRNGGRSAVQTFMFGSVASQQGLEEDVMVFTSPSCIQQERKSVDDFKVDVDNPVILSWLWNAQMKDSLLIKNPENLKFKNSSIDYYEVSISRVGTGKGSSKVLPLKKNVKAPKQYATFTFDEIKAHAFLDGSQYAAEVSAFDKQGNRLVTVESCNFTIKETPVSSNPQIFVKGRLNYQFQKNTDGLHPANHTSLTIEYKPLNSQATLSRKAFFTTDADGNFSGAIEKAEGPHTLRYIVNSPYYKALVSLDTIDFGTYVKDSLTNTVKSTGTKDTVLLGDHTTTVYSYDLTVRVGKGFPEFAFDPNTKTLVSGSTDKLTVVPSSVVKDGIPVRLYRRKKLLSVPYVEGGKRITEFANIKEELIAEAKTTTDPDAYKNGKPASVVRFKNLVINFLDGDEYYIKAVIANDGNRNKKSDGNQFNALLHTKSEPRGDDEENLTGPEMRVVFDKKLMSSSVEVNTSDNRTIDRPTGSPVHPYHYNQTIDYKIISMSPPMSRIKGRIVYAWPSDPGVIRPLRNTEVVVKLRYNFNGKAYPMEITDCATTTYALYKPGSSPKGASSKADSLSLPDEGFVVGTGKTDANGNFEFNIINHNQKGTVYQDAVLVPTTEIKPECAEKPKEQVAQAYNTPMKRVKEKIDAVYDPVESKASQVSRGHEVMQGGEIINFNDGYNVQSQRSIVEGSPVSKGIDFGASNLSSYGFGEINTNTQFEKGAKAGPGGPSADAYFVLSEKPEKFNFIEDIHLDNGNIIHTQLHEFNSAPKEEMDIARVFEIKTVNGYIGGNFMGSGDQFVIDPFATKDFGTIQMKVNEVVDRRITLFAVDEKKKVIKVDNLQNARLLVYRPEKLSSLQSKKLPEGEGSNNHPIKPLNPVSFDDKQKFEPVEWILDHTIALDTNNGTFNVSNLKLLQNYPYMVQVSSDPAKTGATFNAVNGSFLDDEIEIQLGKSRISGRLYDATSGIGLSSGMVQIDWMDPKKNNQESWATVNVPILDKSGYFEVYNYSTNPEVIIWEDNQQLRLIGKSNGYKDAITTPIPVQKKGMNYFKELLLEPGSKVVGIVKGEPGKYGIMAAPISCYVEREDGFIEENDEKTGAFEIKVPDLPSQKLHLIPKDPAYFDSTIVIKNPGKYVYNLTNIVLPRRQHRIQLNLSFLKQDGTPFDIKNITGLNGRFRVTINNESDKSAFSDANGVVKLKFENVSVSNYTVLVEDKLQDFIPVSFQLVNVESKKWKSYSVTLRQAKIIKGVVTLDGKPVGHAKVYADINSSSSNSYGYFSPTVQGGTMQPSGYNNSNDIKESTAYTKLQTYTYANGQYVFRGLPTDVDKIKVIAVLDTTFLVSGNAQTVNMKQIPSSVDFDLKKVGDVSIKDLYGFPLTVEQVVEGKSKGRYLVSGLVDLTKGNSDLQLLDPNTKVRVTDVPVTISKSEVNVDNALVQLKATAGLKMRLMKRYNVLLSNDADGKMNSLALKQGKDGGYVQAYTSIVDNSFNYPSTYLSFGNSSDNFFYLGSLGKDKVDVYNKILSTEDNSNRGGIGLQSNKYHLCNAKGEPLDFKFIGFETKADPKNSFIRNDGKFQLDIKIADVINGDPRLGAVDIHIPDLLIDDQSIYPATGKDPIVMKLQDWSLQIKDWSMDPKQGGLVSTNCLIKTGVVDVPATKFNLRHDLFVLDEFDVSGLKLGGGLVTLTDIAKDGFLVFDEKCGSDLAGHWRLAITSGSQGYAAKISGLKSFTETPLLIDFIQLISYNKGKDDLFSLGQNAPIKNAFGNQYMSFLPQFVTSGLNSFDLTGKLSLNIPRLPELAVNVNFTGTPEKLVASMGSWKGFKFEGPGYVQFSANDQTPVIDKSGVVTIIGSAVEPAKFNPIPGVLTFGNSVQPRIYLPGSNAYKTATKDDKVFRLSLTKDSKGKSGGSDVGLLLSTVEDKNGMWLQGTDWNNFRFSGTLDDPQNNGLMGEKKPVLDFTVYGELQANSDEIKMDDIDTPLGKMKMVYDFGKKELIGSMAMQGVQVGSYKVDADVETRIGSPGFVISGAASVNTGVLLVEGFGTIKMGLVIGHYLLDDPIIERVTQFSLNKKSKCWLNDNKNFKGLYVNGGYNIIDMQHDFDAVIVAAYVHAMLGADATFALNKINSTQPATVASLGVGIYGKVEAGLTAITGTTIEGGVDANLSMQGEYNFSNGNYKVGADAGLSFKAKVKQFLALTTVEKSVQINASSNLNYFKEGSNKDIDFDFQLNSGEALPACYTIPNTNTPK